MAQRLLLNMGMPKTGSSAPQVALAPNREQLSRAGIDYPSAPSDARAGRGAFTSGNGAVVAAEIARAPHTTVAYSSQLLYRASPPLLRMRPAPVVAFLRSGGSACARPTDAWVPA